MHILPSKEDNGLSEMRLLLHMPPIGRTAGKKGRYCGSLVVESSGCRVRECDTGRIPYRDVFAKASLTDGSLPTGQVAWDSKIVQETNANNRFRCDCGPIL